MYNIELAQITKHKSKAINTMNPYKQPEHAPELNLSNFQKL